jgi:hypothetical protein
MVVERELEAPGSLVRDLAREAARTDGFVPAALDHRERCAVGVKNARVCAHVSRHHRCESRLGRSVLSRQPRADEHGGGHDGGHGSDAQATSPPVATMQPGPRSLELFEDRPDEVGDVLGLRRSERAPDARKLVELRSASLAGVHVPAYLHSARPVELVVQEGGEVGAGVGDVATRAHSSPSGALATSPPAARDRGERGSSRSPRGGRGSRRPRRRSTRRCR